MDKIDPAAASILGAPFHGGLKPDTKRTRAKGELQGSRRLKFSEILENFAPAAGELGPIRKLAASEEALTELMDAVHSTGSDLKDRPFPDEILRYKKAVRNFINYVVENGYEMLEVQGIKKKTVIRGEAKWKDVVYHQVRLLMKASSLCAMFF